MLSKLLGGLADLGQEFTILNTEPTLRTPIDNLFDVKTAQDIYDMRTFWNLIISDEKLLSGDWDLEDPDVGYVPDPAFMMKAAFYPPISVRLGVKFIF